MTSRRFTLLATSTHVILFNISGRWAIRYPDEGDIFCCYGAFVSKTGGKHQDIRITLASTTVELLTVSNEYLSCTGVVQIESLNNRCPGGCLYPRRNHSGPGVGACISNFVIDFVQNELLLSLAVRGSLTFCQQMPRGKLRVLVSLDLGNRIGILSFNVDFLCLSRCNLQFHVTRIEGMLHARNSWFYEAIMSCHPVAKRSLRCYLPRSSLFFRSRPKLHA